MTVLLFIIILGLLVFVHELGHFLAARHTGVQVEEFGFGFPPRILGWQRGPTLYSLNWIPFGGFVRLQGEHDDAARRSDSFVNAPYRRQFLIMIAGVSMNVLFAWLLMSLSLTIGVKADASSMPQNRFVQVGQQQVEALVNDGSPAFIAGLRSGDVIRTVNDQPLQTTTEVISEAERTAFAPLLIVVRRQSSDHLITISPQSSADHPRYGFGIQSTALLRYPWYVSPWYGLLTTIDLGQQTLVGFGNFFSHLLTTAKVNEDVTGPVGIAVLTGQIIRFGFTATLQFMAVLSVSLAVVNFLPLPALDGGRAVFVTIGRIRGKPVDQRIENTIHTIGFYALILLIILLSIRDVSRFRIIDQLRSLFLLRP